MEMRRERRKTENSKIGKEVIRRKGESLDM